MTTRYIFTALILLVVMVSMMGCTESSNHDRYTQATIVEMFEKTRPLFGVDPERVSVNTSPGWFYHDYYIRYTISGDMRVDRVSEEVYKHILEGSTYVLHWGYIDDVTSKHEYGYTKVISEVK